MVHPCNPNTEEAGREKRANVVTHTYKAGRLQKSEASLTHEDQEQRGRRTAFLPAVNGIRVLPCSVSSLFSVFTSCLLLCVQVHLEGRRQL